MAAAAAAIEVKIDKKYSRDRENFSINKERETNYLSASPIEKRSLSTLGNDLVLIVPRGRLNRRCVREPLGLTGEGAAVAHQRVLT